MLFPHLGFENLKTPNRSVASNLHSLHLRRPTSHIAAPALPHPFVALSLSRSQIAAHLKGWNTRRFSH
ncbi:hypothetical protein AAHA92_00494 [Salvia divinorum]|uniref:Uncharacterized protein n=1 Tax=Salvia divinorum TaxID=28513 RepID=A0ABD1IKE4_SALDI